MKIFCLAGILFCAFLNKAYAQTSQSDFNFGEPADSSTLSRLVLWSTQYYIHKFRSGGNIPIVYADGKPSGLFADTCNFCDAALEGTAYITDSLGNHTVINYARTGEQTFVNCRRCKKYEKSKLKVESWGKTLWSKSKGFGDGVLNYKLIPFRTIAVDKNKIPYGTVLFVPGARGKIVELPNGQKVQHDGYFFAGDTGGAIKGNHIDLFTGIFTKNPFPDVVKSNPKKTFTAYIITDTSIKTKLKELQTK